MTALERARAALSDRSSRIALVGASNQPQKYGNKILRDLRRRGYAIVPVNLHEAAVEGLPAVPSLAQVEPPIAIINVVVPPEQALRIAREADPSLCDLLWFQPGAYDDRVVQVARERFPYVLAGDCIMVLASQV